MVAQAPFESASIRDYGEPAIVSPRNAEVAEQNRRTRRNVSAFALRNMCPTI